MKLYIVPVIFALLVMQTACKKETNEDHDHDHDDETEMVDPNYSISIMSPSEEDKHVGDEIHLHINLKSDSEQTVHHANVRIFNKADSTEIYNKPDDAHVHEEDGLYEYHDDFVLSNENSVVEHTNWILEAKVWGHDGDEHEVKKSIEFHVHP